MDFEEKLTLQELYVRTLANELAYMNNLELGSFDQVAVKDALRLSDGNMDGVPSAEDYVRTVDEANAALGFLTRSYSGIVGISRSRPSASHDAAGNRLAP